jgi:DNA-binding NarL/FixJ family response regulator
VLRVLIADDHPVYRRALAGWLRASGLDVVAEVPNGHEAVRAALELEPDVVLMDLNMPGRGGLAATEMLRARLARTQVVILTVSALADDLVESLAAGAAAYLVKDSPVDEIVACIRAAAAGSARPVLS